MRKSILTPFLAATLLLTGCSSDKNGALALLESDDVESESVYCNLNTAALQEELDRMVQRSGVRAFLGADFVTAETDRPGHVTRAVIEDKSGRRAIAARFFIDCSGDSAVLLAISKQSGHRSVAIQILSFSGNST